MHSFRISAKHNLFYPSSATLVSYYQCHSTPQAAGWNIIFSIFPQLFRLFTQGPYAAAGVGTSALSRFPPSLHFMQRAGEGDPTRLTATSVEHTASGQHRRRMLGRATVPIAVRDGPRQPDLYFHWASDVDPWRALRSLISPGSSSLTRSLL